jgi:flavin reductase (DIM6/NTAB) family NADH-FMN oxidoreductase RutF
VTSTAAPLPPSSPDFRTLMSRWPTGVSVVTARERSADVGMTVNAFLSVSLSPPSVLVSLSTDADTTPIVERTGLFAVNFLSHRQLAISQRFALAVPPAEKFAGLPVHRGTTGVALLDGTLGALECRVTHRTTAYDHILFVGEVVRLEVGPDETPLLFARSGYPPSDPEGRVHLGRPPGR